MNIIIVGAGFTGIKLAKLLVSEKNKVVLIDNDEDIRKNAENLIDCTCICADGNNIDTLEDAGIAKADALVCLTSSDEVNMITCSLADAVYPNVTKIARVRNYAYYMNTAEALKKHSESFAGKRRPLYGIDYMVHPDVEAAEAIYQAVENGAIGNIITFDNSDLEIAAVIVSKGSEFDGLSLKDIRTKTDFPFLVTYVEQNGVTALPSGDTVITENTTLGVLVSKEDLNKVTKLCGSIQKELNKILLIGAGRIGTIVSEKILRDRYEKNVKGLFGRFKTKRSQDFVIIDSDGEQTRIASEHFSGSSARVVCGDAFDENILTEEGLINFDLAICVTHNHELNMVLAAYLESLGIGQSISLVTSARFAEIAEKLGVDVSIPLQDCVVDTIMSHLRGKSVKEVHTVSSGDFEIVECEINTNSKISGKALKEISDPGNFLVLLHRKAGKEEYSIATGNSQIFPGDHVVLIAKSENSKKLLQYFAGTSN